jgi:nucleoside 2-deoxyribosyltransferase
MLKIYLAGAIEKSPDGGRSIRQEIKILLSDLPVKLIDPCDFDVNSQYKSLNEAKHHCANWKEMAKVIIRQDLNAIRDCDIVLATLTQHAGFGTFTEIVFAHYCGKRVVVYFADDVLKDEYLHIWVQAIIDSRHTSPDTLKDFIRLLNQTGIYQKE